LVEGGAVDPDRSPQRKPRTHERAHQRRFTRGRWANDAEPIAGNQRECDIRNDGPGLAWRGDEEAVNREALFRPRQAQPFALSGNGFQDLAEAGKALARRYEAAPIGDRDLYGRKRARSKNGRGNYYSTGRLSEDDDVGAEGQGFPIAGPYGTFARQHRVHS